MSVFEEMDKRRKNEMLKELKKSSLLDTVATERHKFGHKAVKVQLSLSNAAIKANIYVQE